MRDFEDSTLWRVSAYQRLRLARSSSAFAPLGDDTVLPSTLLADLDRLGSHRQLGDALEVLAACLRHREPALLCLGFDDLVWPVTVFPADGLYHSPRDLARATPRAMAALQVLSCDAPGLRPPGHWMHERVGRVEHYRALEPMLWNMALVGPRPTLLAEIAGAWAYRATLSAEQRPGALGALSAAAERLRTEPSTLRTVAAWPGMNEERASRLLNALYLAGALMVVRAPVPEPRPLGLIGRLLNRRG
jgi:hypothetical protein